MITGDLNFPNIDWNTLEVKTDRGSCKTCAEDLLSFMNQHFLSQVVDKPTRVANENTANTLDIIITNRVDCIIDIDIQQTSLSDHDLVTAILSNDFATSKLTPKSRPPVHHENSLSSLNFHKADFCKINEELQTVDWENLKDSFPAIEFPVRFYHRIWQICSKHTPLKDYCKKR